MRHEFVQWWVEKTDSYTITIHSFEDAFEVATLHWKEFFECLFAAFEVRSKNHFAYSFDTVAFEEHVFCTAKTDTLSAELTSLFSIARSISVSANKCLSKFSSEIHDCAKVTVEFRFSSRNLTIVNFAS